MAGINLLSYDVLFTGIDYLHPDLASNYVSTHRPGWVRAHTQIRNICAHAHAHALDLPILLEAQLRPGAKGRGLGPGSMEWWWLCEETTKRLEV